MQVGHHETCGEVAAKAFINCFTAVMSGLTTCLITNDRYLYIAKKEFYRKTVSPMTDICTSLRRRSIGKQ